MALEDTTNKQSFTASAGETQFTFNIPFFDTSPIDETNKKYGDIKLTREFNGFVTEFTPVATFSSPAVDGQFKLVATNNDPEEGGTVTISVAASGGEKFIVERDVAYSQQYDLQEGSTIDPTALNKALDRVVAQNQQQNDTFTRTVEFPVTDSPNRTYTVGSETERANKALGFDGSGNLTEISLSDVPVSSGGGNGDGGGSTITPLAANTNAGLVINNNIISAKVDNSTTKFSGGSIVVNKIDAVNLKDDAVTTSKIDFNAVTNSKIAENAVTTKEIDNNAVTFAKMQNITANRVLGRKTGTGTGDPQEIFIDHNFSDGVSSGHDTLASAKAIKNYVDGSYSKSGSGYIKFPGSGIIIQWGSLTPTARETTVNLPIAFPTGTWNVQASIGQNFTDSTYSDNSLIWGAYPHTLSKIKVMSNLMVNDVDSDRRTLRIYWLAIGH